MAIDIKTIEVLRTDLVKLRAEVDQKNLLIASLSNEKTQLQAERQQLGDQLVSVRSELAAVKSESQASNLALQGQVSALTRQLDQGKAETSAVRSALVSREKELTELQGKYADLVARGSSNEELVKELADLRIQNEFHKTQILSRNQYYEQLSLELEKSRGDRARMQVERDGMEKVLQAEQGRRTALEQELNAVRGRSEFSASDLSGYLNSAIDTFNSQVNLADSSVNYIISELQVDLKAGIGTRGGENLTMVAPSQTQLTEQGLSSFRFTIRAVPQSTEPS